MIMNTVQKMFSGLALAAVSSVLFSHAAEARAIGGFGGRPDSASQNTCFAATWKDVNFTCTGSGRWDLPLVVDNAGNYTPNLSAFASGSSSGVSCSVQAVSQNNTVFSNTNWISPGQGNANVVYQPGTVTVPGGGTLEVACFLSQGSHLFGVTY
jgi:hypothetical protein